MAPKSPSPNTSSRNTSIIPSLIPMRAFSLDEDAAFEEMDDDADLDALVEALFPSSIVPR